MPSRKKVQNTHIADQLRQLHRAVLDIVSVMEPAGSATRRLSRPAGIPLDPGAVPGCLSSSSGLGRLASWNWPTAVGRGLHDGQAAKVARLEGLRFW